MSLFLSSCLFFQTMAEISTIMQQFDFFENFHKIYRKTTAMETILGKFNLFKMESGRDVFLSVFRTPFYDCFQTLNINVFL